MHEVSRGDNLKVHQALRRDTPGNKPTGSPYTLKSKRDMTLGLPQQSPGSTDELGGSYSFLNFNA